jgi:hypothetical protein
MMTYSLRIVRSEHSLRVSFATYAKEKLEKNNLRNQEHILILI